MTESERPPVDPLRDNECRDGGCKYAVVRHAHVTADVVTAFDLASPAAPGWPRCQDGYDLRTEVCPVCSPAAPRPEGPWAAAECPYCGEKVGPEHDARPSAHPHPECRHDAKWLEDYTRWAIEAAAPTQGEGGGHDHDPETCTLCAGLVGDASPAAPRSEGLDVEALLRQAFMNVEMTDEIVGVVNRGSFVDRFVAEYARLSDTGLVDAIVAFCTWVDADEDGRAQKVRNAFWSGYIPQAIRELATDWVKETKA